MFPLLFVILCAVILLAVMGPMMARSYEHDDGPLPHKRAFDILDQRLAKGEIDRSEYDEKRRLISQDG